MTTTVTAQDNAPKVLISEAGRKGDPGTNGTDGAGFNQVRKSLIDNPLCHLFKTNKLVEASAPTGTDSDVTWTRSTTGTYIDRYGVLQTAAIDTPREEKEGFLIEGASTNSLLYSQEMANAIWTGVASVDPNTQLAPDGTSTADKLTDASAVSKEQKRQGFIFNDSIYTYSVYLKKGTALKTSISYATPNLFFKTVTIDWSDLSLSGNASDDSKVTKLGDGWVRLVTVTPSSAGSGVGDVRIYPADSDSPVTETGTVFVWGAQLEELPFASSYIPTTTTAVTRAADIVSIAGYDNIGVLSGASSIALAVTPLGVSSTDNAIFNAYSTSDFNRSIFLRRDDGGYINYFSGNPNNVSSSTLQQTSVISTFDGEGSLKLYVDGVSLQDIAQTYTATTTSSSVIIGQRQSGISHLYAHVKDLRVYDFELNADEAGYLA